MKNMPTATRNFVLGLALSVVSLPALWSVPAGAANLSGAQMIDYTAFPVTTLENVTPKVMLTMSRDHQYFFKAYNDYTDLDGDGAVETTYQNSFEYYGYFDPDKCYTYSNASLPGAPGGFAYFVPMAFGVDHYCDTVAGEWSGNFLNWATMTRMDIVRKIIYGGRRVEDRGTHTILERAHLPNDAHSFAKYYNGGDIGKLTPFSTVRTDTTNGGDGDGIDDQNEGITICNTSFALSGTSQNTNAASRMSVAKGNHALWAAAESYQCRWADEISSTRRNLVGVNGNVSTQSGVSAMDRAPAKSALAGYTNDALTFGGFGPDFSVHVKACESAALISASDDNENCKQYPDGNYKPTGLIQEYGEDERIHFGLFTGTYENNISGGVLRKNVGPLDDEVNVDTNGTFKADPNSAVPSVGILRTLDKFRIYGYAYGNSGTTGGFYFGGGSGDNCGFQLSSVTEGSCNSWGNPVSELYAEAIRYFAGLSPTAAFLSNDNSYIGGLDEADWVDPLDDDNFCAGLNVVMLNSSLGSYDFENTGIFTDIGAPSPVTLTNTIGDEEGYTGNEFLVGRTATETNEYCTEKTVSALGEVRGQCPEGPTIDGTFQIAGMAHYARTEDIRPVLQGNQTVTTYAVQLATNVPRIRIEVGPDREVQLLPAYRLVHNNGGGTLVDFKVVQDQIEVNPLLDNPLTPDADYLPTAGTGFHYGKYMVQWEDSEQGGDFDKDVWGVISYLLDTSDPSNIQLTVTTDVVNLVGGANGQLFGFIVSGTTQDGFHAYSGIFNAAFADPDPTIPDCNSTDGFVIPPPPASASTTNADGNCDKDDDARSHTFTVGTTSANLLPDPLFLAAKYGGFDDSDGDKLPNIQGEYDVRDETGTKVPGGDGLPDTYFFVTNPAALENALRAVFDQIIERVASGTAAAVVASEQEGTGAVFQALYDPVKSDTLGNEAEWIGTLHAIFVDPNGFLREDSDDDDTLDPYTVDKVIEIFFDENERRARLRRFTSSSAAEFVESGSSVAELETLNPIWNAREQLSALTDVTTQRSYSDTADNGRHILTWLDTDYDGRVKTDGTEQVAFTTATFTDSTYGWLDVWDGVTMSGAGAGNEARKLVDYIRGEEQAGYRARVVDYDRNGTAEIMRIGDIVNSTPTVQGTPAEAFDILSLDNSYGEFRAQYANRRNVVYVGANDGMIHAFNGGFFDVSTDAFVTSQDGAVAHPLGSELWAYIPKNLLGHLQWLKEEDYSHVFYNDLKPFVFDAKIFPDDLTHPKGWGTVLVVGMRLGGGHDNNGIVLDTAANGIGGANAADDVATKSAYVVMDITDPEQPPKVIAELSPPNQFFTTSFPAVVLVGAPTANGPTNTPNKWYLLLGSGPTSLGSVESSMTARLFAYDLHELRLGNAGLITSGPFAAGFADTGDPTTFVGDITVSDQDLDMKAEAVYFGTVGNQSGIGGNLHRMTIAERVSPSDWGSPFKLLAANRPFVSRPSITLDEKFNTWIIAGNGRLYTNQDKSSTATETLYGFIDPNSLFDTAADTPADIAAFIDVTDAATFSDGSVDLDDDGSFDSTFEAVTADVEAAGGWKLDYNFDPSFVSPSERTVSNQTLIGGIVLSSAFTPTTDLCGAEGESRIIGRAFDSGLVPPLGVFGQIPCPGCPTGITEASGSIDLGAGLASAPSIHLGNQDVPGKVTVIVQQSTGAITGKEAQTLGGLNNGEVSWQEFRVE